MADAAERKAARGSARDWRLEAFLDSLILELDRAQDTLAVKGITRRMTYTVRDLAVDLQVFPAFEDGRLRFNVAKPGEAGASRISFQLGSITDRQIRENANQPPDAEDVTIDAVPDIDSETKDMLEKVGVRSARDIEKLDSQRIDVGQIVKDKAGAKAPANYGSLAEIINKARRRKSAPVVKSLSAAHGEDGLTLILSGSNLSLASAADGFPFATVNGVAASIPSHDGGSVHLSVGRAALRRGENTVRLALDPYALLQFSFEHGEGRGE